MTPFQLAAPPLPFFDKLGDLWSGDPVIWRQALGTMAGFSVRIAVALLILAFTLWAAKRLSRLAATAVQRAQRHHIADETLADFVSALVKYLVVAIGLIAVLGQLGVQTISVLAVLGAASLAIGLALQGKLGNVAAGVMILLVKPYRVGDRVELNGRQGRVAGLDLFNTKIKDYDGQILYLPNGKVFGDMIVNTSQSGRCRIELTFGVDYEDDLDLALKLLRDLAAADERVMKDPAPWSRVTQLGDSSVSVTLRCWTDPDQWMNTRFDLIKMVKQTFEANGLSFPYPHQVSVTRRGPTEEGRAVV